MIIMVIQINQLSDNGAPFNSKRMEEFAGKSDIQLEKIPPLHPCSNPAENFMRPLGKTMKIANKNKTPERIALQQLLENYRDTPHPATGVPPAGMLFHDGQKGSLPHKIITEHEVSKARLHDAQGKKEREYNANSSKYRRDSGL